ncbi:Protein of unknown function DUF58 [Cryptosporangium aurantiacum]|uniref:DUF58 domain-containing protein n=1 Tax=Cryptosporangium aurantiacum TaxID=134849 RepID=A0A1M7JBI4_9ACTN|nr:DUF58 domain-containing protein [Cryptosporangium aurantiacum]SHM50379.1 Protein of unknown function DUF58 [Cryptosporangium aurantiacum]
MIRLARRSEPVAAGAATATAADMAAESAAAEAVLKRLQLTVTRKLDGLLQGDYVGLLPGPGSEAGESREYTAGDDVRRMDWPVTARTTVPHVRQTIADRELETWLCVDLSASLDFGTARCEKRDLAIAAAAAIGYLTVRGGNRVGAVVTNGETSRRLAARPGRNNAHGMLRRIFQTPRAPAGGTAANAGYLAEAVDALNRPPRRRGQAVVISDFLTDDIVRSERGDTEPAWERPMRKLAVRHDVLAIEIVDPRELSLPAVGVLTVVDPESGAVHEVSTDAKVRKAYADAAATQRTAIAGALRRAGAAHLRLSTDSDWLLDIVRFVAAQRRGRSRGTTR